MYDLNVCKCTYSMCKRMCAHVHVYGCVCVYAHSMSMRMSRVRVYVYGNVHVPADVHAHAVESPYVFVDGQALYTRAYIYV